jgi:hypothetical protein
MAARACGHCGGTGRCDRICCTTFGNRVRVPQRDGTAVVLVCMLCKGSGRERQAGAR